MTGEVWAAAALLLGVTFGLVMLVEKVQDHLDKRDRITLMLRKTMEEYILTKYNGPDWPYKLRKMSDSQVYAIYMRLINSNR